MLNVTEDLLEDYSYKYFGYSKTSHHIVGIKDIKSSTSDGSLVINFTLSVVKYSNGSTRVTNRSVDVCDLIGFIYSKAIKVKDMEFYDD